MRRCCESTKQHENAIANKTLPDAQWTQKLCMDRLVHPVKTCGKNFDLTAQAQTPLLPRAKANTEPDLPTNQLHI